MVRIDDSGPVTKCWLRQEELDDLERVTLNVDWVKLRSISDTSNGNTLSKKFLRFLGFDIDDLQEIKHLEKLPPRELAQIYQCLRSRKWVYSLMIPRP